MCSSGLFFYVDCKGAVLQNALIKAKDGRSLPHRLNFFKQCLYLLLHVPVFSFWWDLQVLQESNLCKDLTGFISTAQLPTNMPLNEMILKISCLWFILNNTSVDIWQSATWGLTLNFKIKIFQCGEGVVCYTLCTLRCFILYIHISFWGRLGPLEVLAAVLLLYLIPSVLHSFPHREELFLWCHNQIENLLSTILRFWSEKTGAV